MANRLRTFYDRRAGNWSRRACVGATTMQKRSTYGLRLDQLAGLFSLGIDCPVEGREGQQRMAAMLREHLTCALPAGPLLLDALVMMVGRLGYEARSLGGKTLVELLLDPRTDLGLLRAIKECCKRLSSSLESKAEAAIATTLYYAAMASALVYHDKKITQHSYDALDEACALLMDKPWMDRELAALFCRARGLCQRCGGQP
jgi:hypothetical protein